MASLTQSWNVFHIMQTSTHTPPHTQDDLLGTSFLRCHFENSMSKSKHSTFNHQWIFPSVDICDFKCFQHNPFKSHVINIETVMYANELKVCAWRVRFVVIFISSIKMNRPHNELWPSSHSAQTQYERYLFETIIIHDDSYWQ